jgi:hypothetical protein
MKFVSEVNWRGAADLYRGFAAYVEELLSGAMN